MKKTLLLFAMLLGVLGAWAQRTMPTISGEPQNGEWAENTTWYTLKTKNGYYYKTDLSLSTTSKPTAADIASNHKYQWCITGNETDGYKLYNRYQGASQFLGSDKIVSGTSDCYFTSEVQDKITTFKFRESTHGDAWWCLQLNGNTPEAYLARNGSGGHLIAWRTGYDTAKQDGGAPITFEEVEDLPEISLTNVQPNGDQLTLYIDATSQTLTFSMDSPKELGAKAKFTYVLHDGKYTFYNEASKSFLVWRNNDTSNKGTMSSYNAKYCDWSLTQSQQNGVTYFRMNSKRSGTDNDGTLILLTPVNQKNYRFDGYGNTVGWTTNTNGNQYSNLFTVQINCNLYNEASGSTFQLTYSTPDIGVKPTITINSEGVTLSDEVFDGGSEYYAKVTFPFPVSSETKINPTMISSFKSGYATNYQNTYKWYVKDDNKVWVSRGILPDVTDLDAYSWAIYPQLVEGTFSFAIKNLATDKYVSTTADYAQNQGASGVVTLENTPKYYTLGNNGYLSYIGTNNKISQYLSAAGSGNTDQALGVWAKEHNGATNSFLPISYTKTISSDGVTTLFTPYAVEIPDGVTVKYVEASKNQATTGNIEYTVLTGAIPANTAVLLEGFAGTHTFNSTEEDVDALEDNILFGYSENTEVSASEHNANVYNLTDKKGRIAFFKYEGTEYQAYAAYLDVTSLNVLGTPEYFNVVDMSNYLVLQTSVEGWTENNPNTHLGTITLTNGENTVACKMEASALDNYYYKLDKSLNTTLAHTRNYRGYKFLGFWLSETELGQTPTLTAEQVNAINETNPIIAKYEVIPGEVTLFYDDDAFSYRIPAIAKTSTDRLIAVSDYRHNLDDIGRDNHGTGTKRIDLVARTSDDNGLTWSETMTIAAGDDSKSGTYQRAFGDAAIVAVGENIVVMAAAGDQVYNGATTASPNRMARIFSSDNGETWSISEITTQMYNSTESLLPNGVAAFFGSGKLVVDDNFNGTGKARIYGALLVRIYNNSQYDNYNNYVVYSDDLGENWKILGGSTDAIAKGDEPKVEILPSGQILLSARRGGGRIFNVFTYGEETDDKTNGSGSWETAVNGCNNGGSNGTNGEIMCIDAKKPDGTVVHLLLQSQPKGGDNQYDRKDVSIWYKEISNSNYTPSTIAADWTKGLQVSTQKSAYSAMAEQADGKIAFFFEEAPCYGDDHTKGYSMVYVPLTLEKITGGKYADKNAQAKTVTVTVTDELGNTYNESLNIFVSDEEAIKNMVESKWAFADFSDDPTVVTDGTSIIYTNTVTLPFKVSNGENTYWHNIYFPANTKEQFYPVYLSASQADDVFVPKVTETQHYGASSYNTKDNASKINWAIYSVNNGLTFKFKNELTGKFIQATNVANGNAQNVKYVDEANATAFEIIPDAATYQGDYALKASIDNSVGYLCSTSATSYHFATHYSGNGHEGAWVKFVEAPDFDYCIGAIERELRAIGKAVGLYATDDDVEAARTAMASANTVKWNTLKEYENIRRDGREVNAPSVGMYRIKNKNTGAYIHGNANGTISLASKFDNYTSIFYLNENNQLISYRMGRHLDGQAKNLAEVNTACDVEFNVAYGGVTEGVLTIKSNGAWIGYIIYEPTIESSTVGTQSAAYDWTFEKVEWLPVPVNTSVGYATLYSPVALNTLAPNTQNHRVEAYIGTIKGDRFSMEQVDAKDGIIPANTPVVLVYKQDAEYGLVYLQVVNSNEEAPAENELRGTFESSYIEDDAYVLSAPEGKLGLYMADKNFYENNGTWTKDTTIGTHFLNNGFKAYLPAIDDASGARFLVFDFGDDIETGITETENGNVKTENTEVYDLSGRRVQGTQKGIFIVNGKKVVR